MLHLVPFIAGAAIGVGAIMLLSNKKTKESLEKGGEYVKEKAKEGAEMIKATKECIGEKLSSKKGQKDETVAEQ